MKLGSLFDGSGGFPLAGALCGITPVWASEVEPYPIAVTRSRFPAMRHLGDVSKVSGADIEPIDVITFGSPCQDLSVAGKRAGLKHTENGDEETTRSGLFMEAVRIIKEMREKSGGIYPAFAVWENVPGAFSSNKGEDFKTVLEELIRITEPEAPPLPAPGKNGWPYADCIVGDGWSVAWRVFDAQYWGVPQRRRRIYLVADFRGERAGKILFEREGLRGYFAEGRAPWQTAPAHAGRSPAAADREGGLIIVDSIGGNAECAKKSQISGTLKETHYKNPPILCYPVSAAGFKAGQGAKAGGIGWQEEIAPTLAAAPSGMNQAPTVCAVYRKGTRPHSADEAQKWEEADVANTINTFDVGEARANLKADSHPPAVCTHCIVRRLTPTECARLQGFPDQWGVPDRKDDFTDVECAFWQEVRDTYAEINGKPKKRYTKAQLFKWYNGLHTDSAEYKMWGNGIALPTALYVMQGIAEALSVEKEEHAG